MNGDNIKYTGGDAGMEHRVDAMIEDMRSECRPAEPGDGEEAEFLAVARMVRTLREESGLPDGLGRRIAAQLPSAATSSAAAQAVQPRRRTLKPVWMVVGGIAAAVVLFVGFAISSGLWSTDIAYAMSRAVSKITAYHGVLEKSYRTSAGNEQVVRRVEVWSWEGGYATRLDDGTLTVNNGHAKWQIRPDERIVAILPILPDSERSGLDLQVEAERAKKYPHAAIGEDVIAGRAATRLEISPPGGQIYEIWADKETNLPLQLRTAVQNGIQTTYTYTEFDAASGVSASDFLYSVPEGYAVVENDPGQIVTTPAEAAGIAGFAPVMPVDQPERILAHASGRIVLDFGNAIITEVWGSGPFVPVSHGSLGTAAGGPVEILEGSLRWRQGALEVKVEGRGRLELAKQIAPDLTLPSAGQSATFEPEVAVQVDMEVAGNDQKQVDGGHSPWQLDPLSVSLTFVNLKVTPDGIVGEPQVPYESFSVESNDGVRCIVGVDQGPVQRVYLEKLVRRDESGIWSVVGYDPR